MLIILVEMMHFSNFRVTLAFFDWLNTRQTCVVGSLGKRKSTTMLSIHNNAYYLSLAIGLNSLRDLKTVLHAYESVPLMNRGGSCLFLAVFVDFDLPVATISI